MGLEAAHQNHTASGSRLTLGWVWKSGISASFQSSHATTCTLRRPTDGWYAHWFKKLWSNSTYINASYVAFLTGLCNMNDGHSLPSEIANIKKINSSSPPTPNHILTVFFPSVNESDPSSCLLCLKSHVQPFCNFPYLLGVILICISLLTNWAEHLHTNLLAMFLSSLDIYLFHFYF